MALSLIVGFGGAFLIGLVAYHFGWLTKGGGLAAGLVGGSVFSFSGWPGTALLLAFFVSSSLLSRLPKNRALLGSADEWSPALPESFREARRARQVMANGAVSAMCAGVLGYIDFFGIVGEQPMGLSLVEWQYVMRLALAGAFAAAAADTWATEIGKWAGARPRSALTGRILSAGESGGMTAQGTFSGLIGAAVIGFVAALVWEDFGVFEAVLITVAGFAGMWFDSLLGASVQHKAECDICGHTEDRRHPHKVTRLQGLTWCDNDVVNLAATGFGAGFAAILGILFFL